MIEEFEKWRKENGMKYLNNSPRLGYWFRFYEDSNGDWFSGSTLFERMMEERKERAI